MDLGANEAPGTVAVGGGRARDLHGGFQVRRVALAAAPLAFLSVCPLDTDHSVSDAGVVVWIQSPRCRALAEQVSPLSL